MPVIVQVAQRDTKEFIFKLMETESNKEYILDVIDRANNKVWMPVTLIGGGLFHLSL